jgi:membrane protease YdiL (CAAX protease family)
MDRATLELVFYWILSAILLASLLGILWTWIWAVGRIWRGNRLLEGVQPLTTRQVPWGGLTVLAVVLLYFLVNIAVTHLYAAATGRHLPQDSKPAEKLIEPRRLGQEPGTLLPAADESPKQSQAELMAQLAVINVLLIVLVPGLLRLTSKATLLDLGLSFKDWRRQMAVGVVGAFLMTPAVFAVQSLAVRVWPPQKHPLEDMVRDEFTIGVAILALLSAMILAPVIEEMLFRGVLQRWLSKVVGDASSSNARTPNSDPLEEYKISGVWSAENPVDQLLEETGALGADRWPDLEARLVSALPIIFASFLFAVVHLRQWPAPISIFLLAIALGAIYRRTGSLITIITMHGTFNGFSTLALLLEALGNQMHPHNPVVPPALTYQGFFADLLHDLGRTLAPFG